MTARDDAAVDSLYRLADDGQIHAKHLPEPVTDRMQWVVDRVAFRCAHVAAAHDLPASALAKQAIAGVPGLWCSAPVCIADAAQTIQLWRGIKIDDSCVLCGRQPTAYRTVFTDEAIALSMVAWVCKACVPKLASWVGLP